MDDSRRSLIWHGMFLFLLGLLTGFVETKFANPRMGLAAHLEGVMNGTFLIALGAVWMEVKLPLGLKAAAYWSALYGAYANWATTALGAAWGIAALSPITGAGHHALPWQETLITAMFMSVGLAVVGSTVLMLWGLRRSAVTTLTTDNTDDTDRKRAENKNLPRRRGDTEKTKNLLPLIDTDDTDRKSRETSDHSCPLVKAFGTQRKSKTLPRINTDERGSKMNAAEKRVSESTQ